MKTSVHLVSAPWAYPTIAPVQLGCLSAHLRRRFGPSVRVRSLSAFAEIPFGLAGPEFVAFHRHWNESQRELLSLLAYDHCYGRAGREDPAAAHHLIETIETAAAGRAKKRGWSQRFTLKPDDIRRLGQVVQRYADDKIVAALDADAVNLVGFSLNYSQVFMSILLAQRVRSKAANVVFLFGGGSVSHPLVVSRLVQLLGKDIVVVLGEGELKLESIVAKCLEARADDPRAATRQLPQLLAERDDGVFHGGDVPDLTNDHEAFYRRQIADLSALPLPDYAEYMATLRTLCRDSAAFSALRSALEVTAEGTRGCFAHCDFCSLNRSWSGFRKSAGAAIAERALELRRRHRARLVYFADNVCDTWAEEYSEHLIERGVRLPAHMQVRAHHPELFWVKLALAGVEVVQLGIEALSPPLLQAMAKGTRVSQNIRALKHLTELGVRAAQASNLITHHPRSTLADVAETKRVLSAIGSFGRLNLVRFQLQPGSPLYASLTHEEKHRLEPASSDQLPPVFRDLMVEKQVCIPSRWRDAAVETAWEELIDWYERQSEESAGEYLRCLEGTARRTWIRGRRRGKEFEVVLEGEEARIYQACHQGPTLRGLAVDSGLARADIVRSLANLEERGLLLHAEEHYFALGLRPRDALLMRCLGASPAVPAQARDRQLVRA